MEETSTMPDSAVPGPAPAVPPTPPVPLAALLAREDLGLRQIAGPRDSATVIHWAHTSEMADPYPYLLGGELLLTAGVHVPEAAGSGTYFDDYVSRIVEAGGAALGFGVAPVHDTVPRALVVACDDYGLPLVEVPPRTTFSGVARAVWQLMAQARHTELRRVTEAQQSLAAAAARPDPVPSVLRQLAQRVGGRAALYAPDGGEVASAGRVPGVGAGGSLDGGSGSGSSSGSEVSEALAGLVAVVRPATGNGSGAGGGGVSAGGGPTPSSASDTAAGVHLAAYALGTGQGFVLGVAAPRRDPGDHTIASVGAVLLSLLTGEHQSSTGAARSSALVRLLLGAAPEEVAPLLGGGERWVVVHARPDGPAPDAVTASALGAALGSALVDVDGDVVRVLVAAGRRELAVQPGWTCGASAPVGPHEWASADTQAARALSRARATRTRLVRHGEHPGLAGLVPPDEAAAHARTVLAPITANPALTETLRTWLSLHGSWDRTAVALSVHRNTVRQRIARCATLLSTDLDDPDVRMELWFALRQA
ncbi:PucR family transcriptional regulator [Streptomyces phaeochromogenes]|jgi:purine catabolism regulatory family protein/PucR-like helix-turn-helix protein|uniref:PucR family transcriptional regulator n=1 Tax=Streptomyces phaeochromogenes TaxID=1923 RepID=UPI0027D825E7|nr:PucR family transcriptional regulator [Streptomyces phaeochromogenes]